MLKSIKELSKRYDPFYQLGYMVYEDLSHYELVPISVLNTIPKMYSTHMFKNVTLPLWLVVITQKSYLLKEMKLKILMKNHLKISVSSS